MQVPRRANPRRIIPRRINAPPLRRGEPFGGRAARQEQHAGAAFGEMQVPPPPQAPVLIRRGEPFGGRAARQEQHAGPAFGNGPRHAGPAFGNGPRQPIVDMLGAFVEMQVPPEPPPEPPHAHRDMLDFVGELDGFLWSLDNHGADLDGAPPGPWLEKWLARAEKKEQELKVVIGKFVRNEPRANLHGEVLRPKNQDMLKAYTLLKEGMVRAKFRWNVLKRVELDRDIREMRERAYAAGLANSNGPDMRF